MTLALFLIATFFVTVMTGPSGQEYLENRRRRLEAPKARVLYLPSAACRVPCEFCGYEQCGNQCIDVRPWPMSLDTSEPPTYDGGCGQEELAHPTSLISLD